MLAWWDCWWAIHQTTHTGLQSRARYHFLPRQPVSTMEIMWKCQRSLVWYCAGVLLGVLLLSPLGEADHGMPAMGCVCPTYHPQDHICHIADVVFRAIILWKERTSTETKSSNDSVLVGSSLTYSMLTDKIYRRHPKVRRGREILVKTLDTGLKCGVTGLRVNEEYLISGNVMGGEVVISLCNFIRPWNKVTSMQRGALKGEYKESCGTCTVVQKHNRQVRSMNDSIFIPIEHPENITTETPTTPTTSTTEEAPTDATALTCTHDPNNSGLIGMEDCEMEYSACILYKAGSCRWQSNRKYEKCLVKRRRKSKTGNRISMYGPHAVMYSDEGGDRRRNGKKQGGQSRGSKRPHKMRKGPRRRPFKH